jgi:glycosyltransferase involved in cell wall biosynthesis
MINVVMLAQNRPRLTEQAITSFLRHTSVAFRLLIVDDYSASETADMLDEYAESYPQTICVVHSRIAKLGPGLARNIGIKKSEQWGRGDALYITDNDACFLPEWDTRLLEAWEEAHWDHNFMALGGYCHPFQQRGETFGSVRELEALGLLSWMMLWETWDRFGPFDSAVKVNGSEDWAMCQKIRKAGGRVGVLEPAVVINCGVTSSDGKPCPGAATLYSQDIPQGVLLE